MRRTPLIAAALLAAAGAFFRFALIGYGFMALTLVGIAAVTVLYEFFRAKRLRICIYLLTALLALGTAFFAACEIPVVRSSRTDAPDGVDCIIVLGAGVNGRSPSLSMVNRLSAALSFLQDHPDCRAILSGGQGPGEDISEAQAMYEYLTGRGIAPERLLLEERSTSTRENIANSLELLRDMGEEPESMELAVVSSEYHLYRSRYIASKLGVEVYGIAGHTTYPVLRVNYFIREGFAVAYMWLFGI